MATNHKQIIKNSSFFIGGKLAGALASFAAIVVLGHFVPRAIAGTYSYIIAILSIVSIATLPGMNNALVRAVARGREGSLFSILRKRLTWGLIGSLLTLIIGIYFFVTNNHGLGFTFLIAAPFVPLTDTYSDLAVYYWQGKKQFGTSGLVFALYYVGIAVLTIPLFIFTKSLPVLVAGVLAAQTLSGYVAYIVTQSNVSGMSDPDSERLGFHLTIMQGFRIFANSFDKVIVFSLFGPIMTAVYTFAATPASKVWQLIPIGPLSLPELSTYELNQATKKFVLKKTFLLFLFTIPAAVVLILLAPFLYHIFFPHYLDSVLFFRILSIGIAFAPLAFIKSALTAFQKTRALYKNEIAVPLVKVALMLLFGATAGLIGLVIGVTLGTFFEFVLILILFIRMKPSM